MERVSVKSTTRMRSAFLVHSGERLKLDLSSEKYFVRGQIILELKSSEAVSEDDPSNLDYR